MKKGIITQLLLLLFISGFSQNLKYEVRGKSPLIKNEKLNQAKFISDVIPYYPASWIKSYVSVEILATCNSRAMAAMSTNDTLNTAQINILNTADLGTDVIINIKYKYENGITDHLDIGTMHYTTTVVPETEAEYPTGFQQMTEYLKENVFNHISESLFKQGIKVRFTVKEDGEITTAQISTTSGSMITDKLLLEAINKMPKWRPAGNSKGAKVKQEFEFSAGGNEGC
ncbi:MAG: TonB family protein [Bacteroidia bacterium]